MGKNLCRNLKKITLLNDYSGGSNTNLFGIPIKGSVQFKSQPFKNQTLASQDCFI